MPKGIPDQVSDPELELYGLLKREGGDAFSRYNAWCANLSVLKMRWTGAHETKGKK
jgi:hypothetical protein